MASRSDQLGQVVVPLATSGVSAGGSLVSVADPTIEDLLDKFEDVLNDKLSAAWNKAASTMSSVACKGTYPYQPLPVLARLGWQWPALFMWRERERYSDHSQVYRQTETTGHLMYVLPPLPYDRAVKLEPIRVAARVALDMYMHEHGDPEVASGADPMGANTLKSFTFTGGEYTYLEGPDLNQPHPALDMTFVMQERQSFVAGNSGALTRIDTEVRVASEDSDVTAVTTLVTFYAPFPTIDIDSPDSGDDYTVGQTITASGDYTHATSITVSASVNGGAYSSIGAASAATSSWTYSHTIATADVGTYVLRVTALADGMSAEDSISVDISSA